MAQLTKHEYSPYSPRQIYELVADVKQYPDFLPWCRAARIKQQENEQMFLAELVIAFKSFTERYTSRVTLHPPEHDHAEARVDAVMVEGPFHHLTNFWVLKPAENGGTEICLDLNFQFRSKVLDMLIGTVFAQASARMITAFKDRADTLYGAKSVKSST